VHVSATKFKGPNTLSCIPLDEDAIVEPYDDAWLDENALFYGNYGPGLQQNNGLTNTTPSSPDAYVLAAVGTQQSTLRKIYKYLTNPKPEAVTQKFLKKVTKYYAKAGQLSKRTKLGRPLLVIFDIDKRLELMKLAHKSLGHHGEKATWEHLHTRFYWPQMYQDVQHHESALTYHNTTMSEIYFGHGNAGGLRC
jgi:hypothetical protein